MNPCHGPTSDELLRLGWWCWCQQLLSQPHGLSSVGGAREPVASPMFILDHIVAIHPGTGTQPLLDSGWWFVGWVRRRGMRSFYSFIPTPVWKNSSGLGLCSSLLPRLHFTSAVAGQQTGMWVHAYTTQTSSHYYTSPGKGCGCCWIIFNLKFNREKLSINQLCIKRIEQMQTELNKVERLV